LFDWWNMIMYFRMQVAKSKVTDFSHFLKTTLLVKIRCCVKCYRNVDHEIDHFRSFWKAHNYFS
jgi:hypothetical protein